MRFITKIILFACFPGIYSLPAVFSQVSHGGAPLPISVMKPVSFIDLTGSLPSFDELAIEHPPDKHAPLGFAEPVRIYLTPSNAGKWETSNDGTRVWRVGIKYKGAYSMSVTFNLFKIEKGEKVFIYDPPAGGHTVLGAFTADNNKPWGSLAVQPVPGESLIIEYQVPATHSTRGKLSIGEAGIGYRDIFRQGKSKDRFYGASGPCNVDIHCPEGDNWQIKKNAVVRILVNNNELCTGTLMNTAINDATPYILTAAHCIADSADAANAIFVFGYESPYCNGPDGSVIKSISGATLKATTSNLDFTLVQMSKIPPFTYYPYYAGWDHTGSQPSNTVTIHHPNGDVKKISIDDDPPVTSDYDDYDKNSFWKVLQWDKGTTEPGSSGAPLFNSSQRVVGTLSGGDAHCGNSVNDYFQKLSFLWDAYADSARQLKVWLDPKDFGYLLYSGFDPYFAAKKTCDTLTNITEGEKLRLYDYGSADSGYWTGHNEGHITEYAEQFTNSELFSMTGIYIMPAIVKYDSLSDKVTVKVWSGSQKPETLIVSKDVPMSFFQDSVWNFIDFDTIVTVNGNFFAGIEIYYDNPSPDSLTDQFAIFQVEDRSNYGQNTAFYFEKDVWTSYSGTPGPNLYTSLAIEAVLCGEISAISVRSPTTKETYGHLNIFPNPAKENITLSVPTGDKITGTLHIYDLTGKALYERKIPLSTGQITLPLPDLKKGIYLITLETPENLFRNKLVIDH